MDSDRYERVMAVMRREVPDRVPWSIWGHFPALNWLDYYSWELSTRNGEHSAQAHMALLRELDYKMDMLKVTPFYRFMAKIWGSKLRFKNNDEWPDYLETAVQTPEDWTKLQYLDPKKELKESVICCNTLSRDLRTMPFIYTIPSPIVQALNGIGTPERVLEDMKSNPDALEEGLETITASSIDLAKACVDAGASGIFIGIGGGGRIWKEFTMAQIEKYALGYEKRILEAVDCSIKLLHICSTPLGNAQDKNLMESEWINNYPATAINWDDHAYTPIERGKELYGDKYGIIGGLNFKETLRSGTPQQVEEETRKAIEAAGEDGGFMLGPGCTIFEDMPRDNFNAVARAVIKHGYYRK